MNEDVTTGPASPATPAAPCFVVFNPTKVSEEFRPALTAALAEAGWAEVVWLETSEEDPGVAMTRQAVEAKAGLVIAAGGDGTVRVVAAELAYTEIPLGLIPSGTGNLLARNLKVPLDQDDAIAVAIADHSRTIDLIKLTVDEGEPQRFAVMAGIGLDAVIMDATDSKLKKKIGSLAYFVAASQNVDHQPFRLSVRIDDGPELRRKAVVCVIGNVGQLQANIELLPGALPDDGILNVLVASPRNLLGWLRLIAGVLLRRRGVSSGVDHLTGRKVELRIAGREAFQLDGDNAGDASAITAELEHSALILKVPADAA